MTNLFVYCHGYGSSPNSDKVDRIRKQFPSDSVVAFDADIDPNIALNQVGDKVLDALLEDVNGGGQLIIIGTSLGGWLASELADQFDALAIIINPSSDPKETLAKYGVPEEIREKYESLSLRNLHRKRFYIDPDDEVINHDLLLSYLPEENVILEPGVGHRFNGPEFERMLKNIF